MSLCDICEENEAAFIVSLVETGDTNYQCPPCYARLGLEAAKRILPPEEIAAALGPMLIEGGQPKGKNGQASRPRGKRAQAATAKPEPKPEAPEGVEGEAAASSDA